MHATAHARRRRARTTLLAAALPAVLAAAALPAAADAGTIARPTPTIVGFEASPGERNVVETRNAPNGDLVLTDVVPITLAPNSGCRSVNAREVVCPGALESVLVFLRDGDDVGRFTARQPGGVFGGDGNDTFVAGLQPAGSVHYSGDDRTDRLGFDVLTYADTTRGVTVTLDGRLGDGRSGDGDNVMPDIDHVVGTRFDDAITGSDAATKRERFEGLAGNDTIRGGGGPDRFIEGTAANGADTFFGGAGDDVVGYDERTNRVEVQLDALRNDGGAGEADFVAGDVEGLVGGSGDDLLVGNGADNSLLGLDGNDHLQAGAGDDRLTGGSGRDRLLGEGDDDTLRARDGAADAEIVCGTGRDVVDRDATDPAAAGCETATVGVLRLTPEAVRAEAGRSARVALSWRHPQGWRKLDRVVLRVTQDETTVGEVVLRPRGRRMSDEGAVRIVRRASRMGTRGKAATARLALRVDPSLAGERLGLEVEAVDRNGRRQIETDAGTLRVGR